MAILLTVIKLVWQQLMSAAPPCGFAAKWMELGAVVGAAPKENVVLVKTSSG